jgi:hypothetical protein
MRWPLPHAVAGETVATDETFKDDGLRVQSVKRRDAAAVRDAYRAILGELRAFLATADLAPARALAADFRPPPLNLAVVPQSILDAPALWPEYSLSADNTYPSRYVPSKRTLFVNDSSGFERRDLPYGVALHVLTPVAALSDSDIVHLSEKFELHYNKIQGR